MDSTTFKFDPVDKDAPDVVIRRCLQQIEEATRGYVIANIEKYDGPIRNYTKKIRNSLADALDSFQSTSETIEVDIQKDLGAQGDAKNKFEAFITAPALKNYKYRMFFIEYSSIAYPVTIVMNEALARDCGRNLSYIDKASSMAELEEMVNNLINTDTMIRLIQNLINESLRRVESILDSDNSE